MKNEWTDQELRTALEEIVKRADASVEFRARAIEDAAAVMMEVSGKQLPRSISIQFTELDNGELALEMLPPHPDSELNDEELKQVAGGYRDLQAVLTTAVTRIVTGVPIVRPGNFAALDSCDD